MAEYHVLWEINVTAKSAKEAAVEALRCMQVPTTATFFTITNEDTKRIKSVHLGMVKELAVDNG